MSLQISPLDMIENNVSVISKLSDGQKLGARGDSLFVREGSWGQWCSDQWDKTLFNTCSELIIRLLNNSEEMVSINEKRYTTSDKTPVDVDLLMKLKTIWESVIGEGKGLKTLSQTYITKPESQKTINAFHGRAETLIFKIDALFEMIKQVRYDFPDEEAIFDEDERLDKDEGVNLEGECPMTGAKITIPYGFGEVDLSQAVYRSKCSCCDRYAVKVQSLFAKNCQWQIKTINENGIETRSNGVGDRRLDLNDWSFVEIKATRINEQWIELVD